MQTGTVVVLIATITLLFTSAIQIGASLLLLWSLKTLRPEQFLRADILTLQTTVDALEMQVTKLRTRKAGQRSAEKKQQAEEQERDELDGLTEDERALFA